MVRMLEPFAWFGHTLRTMKVVLTAALTADGFIARDANHLSTEWTSPEDKQLMVRISKEMGVVVMGSRTFATIGHGLKGRRVFVYSTHPPESPPEGVTFTALPPEKLVDQLIQEGENGIALWGGASIYRQFMQAGLVDELYLSIEPTIFGNGVGLFDAPIDVPLKLLDTMKLNDNTVLVHYAIRNA